MKVLISHQKTRITTPEVDQDHWIVNVETGIDMMLLLEGIILITMITGQIVVKTIN